MPLTSPDPALLLPDVTLMGLHLSQQALTTRAGTGIWFLLQEDKQTIANRDQAALYAHKEHFSSGTLSPMAGSGN